ncbi:MAG: hypothetical protein K2K81_08555 [Muribaculaceae bacterium]|nr:hypothetical protein [Muribaculaceae bacterium]
MKRLFFILCSVLFMTFAFNAEKIQRFIVNHSLDSFSVQSQDSVVKVICHLLYSASPPYEPSIPIFGYTVSVPKGMKTIGYRIQVPDTILVCKDKYLAKNPAPVCYGDSTIDRTTKALNNLGEPCMDLKGIFPAEKVSCDDVGYLIYPFEYDSKRRELYFTPTVIIDRILISENETVIPSKMESSDVGLDELVSLIIYQGNRDIELKSFKLDKDYNFIEDASIEDPIDYIIITNDWDKEYFKSLLEWKTQKGLRCRIKTVEEIDKEYAKNGATSYERIKAYIYDMYKNHGASYILLGGGVPII